MGAVPMNDEVLALFEKVTKSVAERKPVAVADDVAVRQVSVDADPSIKSPGAPDVAKV